MTTRANPRDKECLSCGASIVWLTTEAGKRIPVDAATTYTWDEVFAPKKGHIAHFATCPQVKEWSRGGSE